MSVLAWARQPPGAPGHKALKRIVEQLARLRAVGLDPACAEGVHPERLRKLAREGGRCISRRHAAGRERPYMPIARRPKGLPASPCRLAPHLRPERNPYRSMAI